MSADTKQDLIMYMLGFLAGGLLMFIIDGIMFLIR